MRHLALVPEWLAGRQTGRPVLVQGLGTDWPKGALGFCVAAREARGKKRRCRPDKDGHGSVLACLCFTFCSAPFQLERRGEVEPRASSLERGA